MNTSQTIEHLDEAVSADHSLISGSLNASTKSKTRLKCENFTHKMPRHDDFPSVTIQIAFHTGTPSTWNTPT